MFKVILTLDSCDNNLLIWFERYGKSLVEKLREARAPLQEAKKFTDGKKWSGLTTMRSS